MKKKDLLEKLMEIEVWIPPKVVMAMGGKNKWVHYGITNDGKKNKYFVNGKLAL